MRNKEKNKLGFTLIELLVVTAVIGLLSSIAVASYNGVREKTKYISRVQQLDAISKALDLYYSDNNSYPPISFGGQANRYLTYDGLVLLNSYLGPYTNIPGQPASALWLYYWNDNPSAPITINSGTRCIRLKSGYVLMLVEFGYFDANLNANDSGITDFAYERVGGDYIPGTVSGTDCI